MYKLAQQQMSLYDYMPPFEGRLAPTNRWVRLAAEVDWDELELQYSAHFGKLGKQATSARAAFGCLVIHDALHLSDEETVRQIRENPYLQYFLGQKNFGYTSPVSVRSMARFRKRIDPEEVARVAARFAEFQKKNLSKKDVDNSLTAVL